MPEELPEWEDVSIYYETANRRWIGAVSLGYDGSGKRKRRKLTSYRDPSHRKAAERDIKTKFQELRSELETGIVTPAHYTIRQCVADWLDSLALDELTVAEYRGQAEKWICPRIGALKLKDFRATDATRFFHDISAHLSKRSLQMIKSTLRRSIRLAQINELIGKNVVELVTLPQGKAGRPSRAMTEDQAKAVFTAARGDRLEAAMITAISLALRPGELREMRWKHIVAYDPHANAWSPVTQAGWGHERLAVQVWNSAAKGGQLKRAWSKRTLQLPRNVTAALRRHQQAQREEREAAGSGWQETGYVFTRTDGTRYTRDALGHWFSTITKKAGIGHWHPHEARHTGVSIMSLKGVDIQDISDTVGHKSTHVTETVYRHVIAPAITGSAAVMDSIFDDD